MIEIQEKLIAFYRKSGPKWIEPFVDCAYRLKEFPKEWLGFPVETAPIDLMLVEIKEKIILGTEAQKAIETYSGILFLKQVLYEVYRKQRDPMTLEYIGDFVKNIPYNARLVSLILEEKGANSIFDDEFPIETIACIKPYFLIGGATLLEFLENVDSRKKTLFGRVLK